MEVWRWARGRGRRRVARRVGRSRRERSAVGMAWQYYEIIQSIPCSGTRRAPSRTYARSARPAHRPLPRTTASRLTSPCTDLHSSLLSAARSRLCSERCRSATAWQLLRAWHLWHRKRLSIILHASGWRDLGRRDFLKRIQPQITPHSGASADVAVANAKGVASAIRHRTPICSGAHWPLQPHHFSNLDFCPPRDRPLAKDMSRPATVSSTDFRNPQSY